MKHLFEAFFTEEEKGYSVTFPYLEGCFTQGETIEEAYENAEEALGLYLQNSSGVFEYPEQKKIDKSILSKDDIVALICFDEIEYLKKTHKKSVKKTLTIPEWLNELAVQQNVNFSNELQNTLIQKLCK